MRYPHHGLAADGETEVHLSRESRAALRGPISIEPAPANETLGERVLRLARAAAALHRNESAVRLARDWTDVGQDRRCGPFPLDSASRDSRPSLEDAS